MKHNLIKILMLFLVAFFISACEKKQAQAMKIPPQSVNILIAKGENIPLAFEYPAKLITDLDVNIKPQVSGTIVKKYFKAGDFVKKDQVLFLIDPSKFQAQVNIAYGNALKARANYENEKVNHERNKKLFDKNVISKKEYDTSLTNFNNAKANLISARGELKNAKIDLNHASVKAPFDGVLGDALVDIGAYVSASNTELVRITNLNPIYADFYISDTTKLNINRNLSTGKWELDNVNAYIDLNGKIYQGKLYFIDSVIDAKSGSVHAKAVFENNCSSLLPGSFITLKSEGFMQKNGFKIPQSAIMQNQKDVYVYTMENNKVHKKDINIVYQNNEYAIIDSGIKENDKIILNNFNKIRPGSDVIQAKGN